MKKLFIICAILITSTFTFAKTFDNNGEIVDKFLQSGTYIKIIKDADNIAYVLKDSIFIIQTDEDDLKIASAGQNMQEFDTRRYKISLDENNNIILKYMGK